jgi:hypothetical protein
MWNFVKTEVNKHSTHNIPPLNMEGSIATDYHELACVFNEYFINAADSILIEKEKETSPAMANLHTVYNKLFPKLY